MPRENQPPRLVGFCNALIEATAHLLPAVQREDWRSEWKAEIWHRWQFLYHAGAWNAWEAFGLFRRCLGAVPDAVWHFTSQDIVQNRIREVVRSPWTCLGGWAAALALLSFFTAGLPATRQVFSHQLDESSGRLLFVWRHPTSGGGDQGLPSDLAPAWGLRSRTLESIAPFTLRHETLRSTGGVMARALVATTDSNLFKVLRPKLLFGKTPEVGTLVLTQGASKVFFHSAEGIRGSKLKIGQRWYQVGAVLPAAYPFLSRQPTVYLIQAEVPGERQMVVARAKPGVNLSQIDRELTRIAEGTCYYFFRGELRYSYLDRAVWIPLLMFGIAVFAAALLLLSVSRPPFHRLLQVMRSEQRRSLAARSGFFAAKTALALLFVFTAALEWSRSQSAILFGSRDPASGPFILWLYILGAMGVLFWSVADQRARCRVCLRLLCFPVRIGCPGCLLLEWSGTELLCTEGHGLLHVPHMAPTWEENSDHWISLDESWKGLFVETSGTADKD